MAPRAQEPRTFDIEAAQSIGAAGYKARRQGKRLDKEGKPINLRMVVRRARRRTARVRSSSPVGGRARHRHDHAGARQGRVTALEMPPEGSARQGRLRIVIWNWSATWTRTLYFRSSPPVPSAATAAPSSRSALRPADGDPGQETGPSSARPKSTRCSRSRDRAPYHVLFYEAARVPTDTFGGWTSADRRADCRSSPTAPRLQPADGARPRPLSPRWSLPASAAPGSSSAAVAPPASPSPRHRPRRRRPTRRC